jgi:hypothetical protein
VDAKVSVKLAAQVLERWMAHTEPGDLPPALLKPTISDIGKPPMLIYWRWLGIIRLYWSPLIRSSKTGTGVLTLSA